MFPIKNFWLFYSVYIAEYTTLIKKSNREQNDNFIAITPQLRRLLRETGIVNIQQQATVVDFSHGEPLHADMTEDLATVFKVAQPFLLKWQVTTQEEIDRLYPQMLEELDALDFCGLWWYLSAWGQKKRRGLG